jgi:uncharacterized protein YbjT (DUF2867 family)
LRYFLATRDTIVSGTLAFAAPEQWLGCAIELAGNELTMPQAAERFGRVIGRPVRYVQVPMAEFRRASGEEQARMFTWFNQVGYRADIPALQALYPALTTLEQWLRRTGWQGAAAAGAAARHT